MFYEDRISVATPEGVTLEVTLAGVGSRAGAAIIDQLIRSALLLALVLLTALVGSVGDLSSGVTVAAILVSVFLVQFAYDVLFETLGGGRTPGKRCFGMRVVKVRGAPVGFVASAIRNVLRIVDALPGIYMIGVLSVLFTVRNQRLGDLAAGTVVVRDARQNSALPPRQPTSSAPTDIDVAQWDVSARWDVTAVTAEDVATVRRFLERRATLTAESRERLAVDMASRLQPKVVGPPREWEPEEFLEYLVAAKSAR